MGLAIFKDSLQGEYQVSRTLRFVNARLEDEYQTHFVNNILVINRIGLILALVMYASFLGIDALHKGQPFYILVLIRLGLVPASILAILAASFKPWYRDFFQNLIAIPLATGVAGICAIEVLTDLPHDYFLYGLILMLLYNYLLSGLSLLYSSLIGCGMVAAFVGLSIVLEHSDWLTLIRSTAFLFSANCIGFVAHYLIERFDRVNFALMHQKNQLSLSLVEAKAQQERLLQNILPSEIIQELSESGVVIPKNHLDVSVMFVDIVGFTQISRHAAANSIVEKLNHLFTELDRIIAKYNIEKLKTIGDCYMCAAGLGEQQKSHAYQCCSAALEILERVNQEESWFGTQLQVRIGIHSGPVVAGVVGESKFAYDIWGDTVNTASRIEKESQPNRINLSESTYQTIKGLFAVESRGKSSVKGLGPQSMYFLVSHKQKSVA